jgi:4-amino-4-deoxy-L-arabinose transferase-like glycosyltransferase
MRASGDFFNPSFNAEPRYHKPILTYWIMQLGVAIGGDNPFGNRLMSSLAGVGTCLVIWNLGRRLFGPHAGLLSGLIMATSPMVFVESKLATTDSILFFFLALCWWSVWRLRESPSWRWALTFWISMALAVLTKGPVGPLFLGATWFIERCWSGRNQAWGRLCWRWGLPLFIAIAAPWYVAIGIISHGEFYEVAMGRHVIHRMTTDMETHGGFPGFYVVGTLVGLYPWSAFLPAALFHAWKQRRTRDGIGFVVAWWLGPLIILELIRTKLIHYFLPATAGSALLIAWFLEAVALSASNLRRWPLGRLSLGLLIGIGLTLSVAFAAGAFVLPESVRTPAAVLAVVLALGTIGSVEPLYRASTRRGALVLASTWAVTLGLVGGWLLPATESLRLTPKVAAGLRELCEKFDAAPLLATYQPPGVVYNFGRPIPVRQDNNWLAQYVEKNQSVAVALTSAEVRGLSRDRRLRLEVVETISGFNIERAREETLSLVILRPGAERQDVARDEADSTVPR